MRLPHMQQPHTMGDSGEMAQNWTYIAEKEFLPTIRPWTMLQVAKNDRIDVDRRQRSQKKRMHMGKNRCIFVLHKK